MTATEENSATQLQWNYAENIYDGRGITFGCVGFCTGTYDGNFLIKYYTTLNPNNPLAKYIPALDAIDAGPHNEANGDGNPSLAGLDGFINDVHNCNDPLFKQAQLYELDELYWNPAVSQFNKIGAKYPLTQALIYDMCVNHGVDGSQSIIDKATSQSGGTPLSGINETKYLTTLMSARDSYLKSYFAGYEDRNTGYKKLLASGNLYLNTPFTFVAWGESFTITGDLGIDTSGGDSGGSGGGAVPVKTPIITWNNPADITYGTALSGTQLNAAASVPGTFVYTPAAGTVLNVGKQTLHVDFTPTDSANYTTASKNVTINVLGKNAPILPTANFSTNVTSGTAPLAVQFNDTSLNEGLGRNWEFGDGSKSTDPNPVHIYNSAGTYIVNLTASNANGTNTARKTITVSAQKPPSEPEPILKINDIFASVTSGKVPLTVNFKCDVTGKPTSYRWKFGRSDTQVTSRKSVSHVYNRPGVYDVTLTITDAAGHTDNITKKAFITVLPKAQISKSGENHISGRGRASN